MKHIRRYWFAVAMSLVLAAVTVVLTLYVPILTGEAVDLMIDKGLVDMPGILAILKKIAIAMVLTALAQWIMNTCNNYITYHVVKDIRSEAFQKIQILPLKYLDGHATSLGGVVVDGGKFNWKNGKFPELCEPDPSYHGTVYTEWFGAAAYAVKLRAQLIRDIGNYLSPMNAFLINLGTETLHLRMQRHSENALKLAKWLSGRSETAWVRYPGLENAEDYALAQKYLPKGCSGVFTAGIKGGRDGVERFMNALKLASIAVHVADLRTMVLHPASMTHRQLTDEQQKEAGITPDLIRISVGLENIDDIIADFEQALKAV